MKFDINNPEHCYILGYFWADCYFGFCKSKGIWEFSFEIKADDFIEIWPIIQKIGFNKFSTRRRKNSQNSQSCIRLAKQSELKFLKDNGFHNKKSGCPLYFQLQDGLKPFFVKGFLDGDGSISVDKNGLFRVGFNGHFNQSWDFLESFCKDFKVDYVVYRKTRKSHHKSHTKAQHHYSVFEFTKTQDRINLCKSIEEINIGLKRKIGLYKKYKQSRLIKQKEKPQIYQQYIF